MTSDQVNVLLKNIEARVTPFVQDTINNPENIIDNIYKIEKLAVDIFNLNNLKDFNSASGRNLDTFLNNTSSEFKKLLTYFNKSNQYSENTYSFLNTLLLQSKYPNESSTNLFTIVNALKNIKDVTFNTPIRKNSLQPQTINTVDELVKIYLESLKKLAFLIIIHEQFQRPLTDDDIGTIFKNITDQATGYTINLKKDDLINFYNKIKIPIAELIQKDKNLTTQFKNFFEQRVNSELWKDFGLFRYINQIEPTEDYDYLSNAEQKLIEETANAQYTLPLVPFRNLDAFKKYAEAVNLPKNAVGLKLLNNYTPNDASFNKAIKAAIYEAIGEKNNNTLDSLLSVINNFKDLNEEIKKSYINQISVAKQLIPQLLAFFNPQQTTSSKPGNPYLPFDPNKAPVLDIDLIPYLEKASEGLENLEKKFKNVKAPALGGADRLKEKILHDITSLNKLIAQDSISKPISQNSILVLKDRMPPLQNGISTSPAAPGNSNQALQYINLAQELDTAIKSGEPLPEELKQSINATTQNPFISNWIGSTNSLTTAAENYEKQFSKPLTAQELIEHLNTMTGNLQSLKVGINK